MKKNTKKMTQEIFDRYITLDVIPELKEEYSVDAVVLQKTKFQFATRCNECNDLILIGDKFDMPNFFKKTSIDSYFNSLLDMDVVWKDEAVFCECEPYEDDDEDEFIENHKKKHKYNENEDDDSLYGSDDDEDEDFGDGRYSIYDM